MAKDKKVEEVVETENVETLEVIDHKPKLLLATKHLLETVARAYGLTYEEVKGKTITVCNGEVTIN